ncbi:MAG: protein kinase [Myxococcota bacterium]
MTLCTAPWYRPPISEQDEDRPTRRPGDLTPLAATELPPPPANSATAATAPIDGPDMPEEGEPIFSPGEIVAENYEVRSMLGEGGMAQVWEARDHVLDRRVALKAARPEPGMPSLRNEARALAAFRHPSLVTVHALAEHRGIEFIVMERIYGISLADHIEQRQADGVPFKVSEVLGPLIDIAEGLAVVHRAGIAHRDIKPDNVMLTADRRVVLMDFGLVLPEFDVADQKVVAGSPPYMPPEALSNSIERGSGQLVDIYALGVIAYEMLAGHRPFDHATDVAALWEMHAAGFIPDITKFRNDLPDGLPALITEMLAKDPSARPQSAEGIAWSLARMRAELERPPTTSSSPPPPEEGAIDVLLVEDDPDLARIMQFYVSSILGEKVTLRHVADGEAAVAALRERAPDLMLLDLHMPKMNGVEVCMHVRGERLADDMKIVAVSAGAQDHDLQLLHQLGIYRFIQKGANLKQNLHETLSALFLSE